MSMQINVDPAALSQEQREAVAGFILAYPGKICAGTCGKDAHESPTAGMGDTATELAKLQHDQDSTLPNVAFGIPDPAAVAFGSNPLPLPPGATAAPSTADAAPLPTVPAAPPAISTGAPVPPPPAVSPAPVAPVPPAPVVPLNLAAGVDLDKNGLPWDARIHAGTKRKNADGSWTAKRGVDAATIAAVEAELRQVMGAPLAPSPAPAPALTVTAGPASLADGAPAPGAPPAPLSGDARAQFVGLVGRASAAMQAQKITQAEINEKCAAVGVPALPLLANRLDLVPQVAASIDALIASRQ